MSKKRIGLVVTLLVGLVGLSISLVTAKNSGALTGEVIESSYQVLNLSCGSCLSTIEQELSQYEGLVNMSADLSLGVVTVGHTEELPEQAIAAVITEAGYPARVLNDQQVKFLKDRAAAGNTGRRGGCGTGGGCGSGGCGLPQQNSQPQG